MSEVTADAPSVDVVDDALVYEVDLDASPEQVWRAIATPELREAWLGEPESGAAEVAAADAPERLDLVWPTEDGDSLISFEISPAEGGSHLTITHRAPQPALETATVLQFRPRMRTVAGAPRWRMAA
jgi:uncharacterized protein YndB with AHSA1/START domain